MPGVSPGSTVCGHCWASGALSVAMGLAGPAGVLLMHLWDMLTARLSLQADAAACNVAYAGSCLLK